MAQTLNRSHGIAARVNPAPLAPSTAKVGLALLCCCLSRFIIMVASFVALGLPAHSQAQWNLMQTNPETAPLNAVVAIGTHIVAVGQSGTIRFSTDNGLKFRTVAGARGLPSLLSVTTDERGTLYACGMNGYLVRSNDSGRSWTTLPRNGSAHHLKVHASVHGVALRNADSTITIVPVGGQSRTIQPPVSLVEIELIDAFVVGVDQRGRIWRTGLEADTWTEFGIGGLGQVRGATLAKIDRDLYLALGDSVVFRSQDRGAKWVSYFIGRGGADRTFLFAEDSQRIVVASPGQENVVLRTVSTVDGSIALGAVRVTGFTACWYNSSQQQFTVVGRNGAIRVYTFNGVQFLMTGGWNQLLLTSPSPWAPYTSLVPSQSTARIARGPGTTYMVTRDNWESVKADSLFNASGSYTFNLAVLAIDSHNVLHFAGWYPGILGQARRIVVGYRHLDSTKAHIVEVPIESVQNLRFIRSAGGFWMSQNDELSFISYTGAHRLKVGGLDQGSTMFFANGDTLMAYSGSRIYRSITAGIMWLMSEARSPVSYMFNTEYRDQIIYWAEDRMLYRSDDWGISSTLMRSIPDFLEGKQSGQTVVVVRNNDFLVSKDLGLTWRTAPMILPPSSTGLFPSYEIFDGGRIQAVGPDGIYEAEFDRLAASVFFGNPGRSLGNVVAWPNPSTGDLRIQGFGGVRSEPVEVLFYSALGHQCLRATVYPSGEGVIELVLPADLALGFYTIRLLQGSSVRTGSIILQR